MMIDAGYAAVSTRKVAAAVGQTPALVHYYFPATDDLLLAVYRRAAARNLERVNQALASPQPLAALWALSTDPDRKSVGQGKSVSVRVDLGGRRRLKTQNKHNVRHAGNM